MQSLKIRSKQYLIHANNVNNRCSSPPDAQLYEVRKLKKNTNIFTPPYIKKDKEQSLFGKFIPYVKLVPSTIYKLEKKDRNKLPVCSSGSKNRKSTSRINLRRLSNIQLRPCACSLQIQDSIYSRHKRSFTNYSILEYFQNTPTSQISKHNTKEQNRNTYINSIIDLQTLDSSYHTKLVGDQLSPSTCSENLFNDQNNNRIENQDASLKSLNQDKVFSSTPNIKSQSLVVPNRSKLTCNTSYLNSHSSGLLSQINFRTDSQSLELLSQNKLMYNNDYNIDLEPQSNLYSQSSKCLNQDNMNLPSHFLDDYKNISNRLKRVGSCHCLIGLDTSLLKKEVLRPREHDFVRHKFSLYRPSRPLLNSYNNTNLQQLTVSKSSGNMTDNEITSDSTKSTPNYLYLITQTEDYGLERPKKHVVVAVNKITTSAYKESGYKEKNIKMTNKNLNTRKHRERSVNSNSTNDETDKTINKRPKLIHNQNKCPKKKVVAVLHNKKQLAFSLTQKNWEEDMKKDVIETGYNRQKNIKDIKYKKTMIKQKNKNIIHHNSSNGIGENVKKVELPQNQGIFVSKGTIPNSPIKGKNVRKDKIDMDHIKSKNKQKNTKIMQYNNSNNVKKPELTQDLNKLATKESVSVSSIKEKCKDIEMHIKETEHPDKPKNTIEHDGVQKNLKDIQYNENKNKEKIQYDSSNSMVRKVKETELSQSQTKTVSISSLKENFEDIKTDIKETEHYDEQTSIKIIKCDYKQNNVAVIENNTINNQSNIENRSHKNMKKTHNKRSVYRKTGIYASGQLTNGIYPEELRVTIYKDTSTIQKQLRNGAKRKKHYKSLLGKQLCKYAYENFESVDRTNLSKSILSSSYANIFSITNNIINEIVTNLTSEFGDNEILVKKDEKEYYKHELSRKTSGYSTQSSSKKGDADLESEMAKVYDDENNKFKYQSSLNMYQNTLGSSKRPHQSINLQEEEIIGKELESIQKEFASKGNILNDLTYNTYESYNMHTTVPEHRLTNTPVEKVDEETLCRLTSKQEFHTRLQNMFGKVIRFEENTPNVTNKESMVVSGDSKMGEGQQQNVTYPNRVPCNKLIADYPKTKEETHSIHHASTNCSKFPSNNLKGDEYCCGEIDPYYLRELRVKLNLIELKLSERPLEQINENTLSRRISECEFLASLRNRLDELQESKKLDAKTQSFKNDMEVHFSEETNNESTTYNKFFTDYLKQIEDYCRIDPYYLRELRMKINLIKRKLAATPLKTINEDTLYRRICEREFLARLQDRLDELQKLRDVSKSDKETIVGNYSEAKADPQSNMKVHSSEFGLDSLQERRDEYNHNQEGATQRNLTEMIMQKLDEVKLPKLLVDTFQENVLHISSKKKVTDNCLEPEEQNNFLSAVEADKTEYTSKMQNGQNYETHNTTHKCNIILPENPNSHTNDCCGELDPDYLRKLRMKLNLIELKLTETPIEQINEDTLCRRTREREFLVRLRSRLDELQKLKENIPEVSVKEATIDDYSKAREQEKLDSKMQSFKNNTKVHFSGLSQDSLQELRDKCNRDQNKLTEITTGDIDKVRFEQKLPKQDKEYKIQKTIGTVDTLVDVSQALFNEKMGGNYLEPEEQNKLVSAVETECTSKMQDHNYEACKVHNSTNGSLLEKSHTVSDCCGEFDLDYLQELKKKLALFQKSLRDMPVDETDANTLSRHIFAEEYLAKLQNRLDDLKRLEQNAFEVSNKDNIERGYLKTEKQEELNMKEAVETDYLNTREDQNYEILPENLKSLEADYCNECDADDLQELRMKLNLMQIKLTEMPIDETDRDKLCKRIYEQEYVTKLKDKIDEFQRLEENIPAVADKETTVGGYSGMGKDQEKRNTTEKIARKEYPSKRINRYDIGQQLSEMGEVKKTTDKVAESEHPNERIGSEYLNQRIHHHDSADQNEIKQFREKFQTGPNKAERFWIEISKDKEIEELRNKLQAVSKSQKFSSQTSEKEQDPYCNSQLAFKGLERKVNALEEIVYKDDNKHSTSSLGCSYDVKGDNKNIRESRKFMLGMKGDEQPQIFGEIPLFKKGSKTSAVYKTDAKSISKTSIFSNIKTTRTPVTKLYDTMNTNMKLNDITITKEDLSEDNLSKIHKEQTPERNNAPAFFDALPLPKERNKINVIYEEDMCNRSKESNLSNKQAVIYEHSKSMQSSLDATPVFNRNSKTSIMYKTDAKTNTYNEPDTIPFHSRSALSGIVCEESISDTLIHSIRDINDQIITKKDSGISTVTFNKEQQANTSDTPKKYTFSNAKVQSLIQEDKKTSAESFFGAIPLCKRSDKINIISEKDRDNISKGNLFSSTKSQSVTKKEKYVSIPLNEKTDKINLVSEDISDISKKDTKTQSVPKQNKKINTQSFFGSIPLHKKSDKMNLISVDTVDMFKKSILTSTKSPVSKQNKKISAQLLFGSIPLHKKSDKINLISEEGTSDMSKKIIHPSAKSQSVSKKDKRISTQSLFASIPLHRRSDKTNLISDIPKKGIFSSTKSQTLPKEDTSISSQSLFGRIPLSKENDKTNVIFEENMCHMYKSDERLDKLVTKESSMASTQLPFHNIPFFSKTNVLYETDTSSASKWSNISSIKTIDQPVSKTDIKTSMELAFGPMPFFNQRSQTSLASIVKHSNTNIQVEKYNVESKTSKSTCTKETNEVLLVPHTSGNYANEEIGSSLCSRHRPKYGIHYREGQLVFKENSRRIALCKCSNACKCRKHAVPSKSMTCYKSRVCGCSKVKDNYFHSNEGYDFIQGYIPQNSGGNVTYIIPNQDDVYFGGYNIGYAVPNISCNYFVEEISQNKSKIMGNIQHRSRSMDSIVTNRSYDYFEEYPNHSAVNTCDSKDDIIDPTLTKRNAYFFQEQPRNQILQNSTSTSENEVNPETVINVVLNDSEEKQSMSFPDRFYKAQSKYEKTNSRNNSYNNNPETRLPLKFTFIKKRSISLPTGTKTVIKKPIENQSYCKLSENKEEILGQDVAGDEYIEYKLKIWPPIKDIKSTEMSNKQTSSAFDTSHLSNISKHSSVYQTHYLKKDMGTASTENLQVHTTNQCPNNCQDAIADLKNKVDLLQRIILEKDVINQMDKEQLLSTKDPVKNSIIPFYVAKRADNASNTSSFMSVFAGFKSHRPVDPSQSSNSKMNSVDSTKLAKETSKLPSRISLLSQTLLSKLKGSKESERNLSSSTAKPKLRNKSGSKKPRLILSPKWKITEKKDQTRPKRSLKISQNNSCSTEVPSTVSKENSQNFVSESTIGVAENKLPMPQNRTSQTDDRSEPTIFQQNNSQRSYTLQSISVGTDNGPSTSKHHRSQIDDFSKLTFSIQDNSPSSNVSQCTETDNKIKTPQNRRSQTEESLKPSRFRQESNQSSNISQSVTSWADTKWSTQQNHTTQTDDFSEPTFFSQGNSFDVSQSVRIDNKAKTPQNRRSQTEDSSKPSHFRQDSNQSSNISQSVTSWADAKWSRPQNHTSQTENSSKPSHLRRDSNQSSSISQSVTSWADAKWSTPQNHTSQTDDFSKPTFFSQGNSVNFDVSQSVGIDNKAKTSQTQDLSDATLFDQNGNTRSDISQSISAAADNKCPVPRSHRSQTEDTSGLTFFKEDDGHRYTASQSTSTRTDFKPSTPQSCTLQIEDFSEPTLFQSDCSRKSAVSQPTTTKSNTKSQTAESRRSQTEATLFEERRGQKSDKTQSTPIRVENKSLTVQNCKSETENPSESTRLQRGNNERSNISQFTSTKTDTKTPTPQDHKSQTENSSEPLFLLLPNKSSTTKSSKTNRFPLTGSLKSQQSVCSTPRSGKIPPLLFKQASSQLSTQGRYSKMFLPKTITDLESKRQALKQLSIEDSLKSAAEVNTRFQSTKESRNGNKNQPSESRQKFAASKDGYSKTKKQSQKVKAYMPRLSLIDILNDVDESDGHSSKSNVVSQSASSERNNKQHSLGIEIVETNKSSIQNDNQYRIKHKSYNRPITPILAIPLQGAKRMQTDKYMLHIVPKSRYDQTPECYALPSWPEHTTEKSAKKILPGFKKDDKGEQFSKLSRIKPKVQTNNLPLKPQSPNYKSNKQKPDNQLSPVASSTVLSPTSDDEVSNLSLILQLLEANREKKKKQIGLPQSRSRRHSNQPSQVTNSTALPSTNTDGISEISLVLQLLEAVKEKRKCQEVLPQSPAQLSPVTSSTALSATTADDISALSLVLQLLEAVRENRKGQGLPPSPKHKSKSQKHSNQLSPVPSSTALSPTTDNEVLELSLVLQLLEAAKKKAQNGKSLSKGNTLQHQRSPKSKRKSQDDQVSSPGDESLYHPKEDLESDNYKPQTYSTTEKLLADLSPAILSLPKSKSKRNRCSLESPPVMQSIKSFKAKNKSVTSDTHLKENMATQLVFQVSATTIDQESGARDLFQGFNQPSKKDPDGSTDSSGFVVVTANEPNKVQLQPQSKYSEKSSNKFSIKSIKRSNVDESDQLPHKLLLSSTEGSKSSKQSLPAFSLQGSTSVSDLKKIIGKKNIKLKITKQSKDKHKNQTDNQLVTTEQPSTTSESSLTNKKTEKIELVQSEDIKDSELSSTTTIEEKMPIPNEQLSSTKAKKNKPIPNEKLMATRTKKRKSVQSEDIKDSELSSSTTIKEKMPIPNEQLPSTTKTNKKMPIPTTKKKKPVKSEGIKESKWYSTTKIKKRMPILKEEQPTTTKNKKGELVEREEGKDSELFSTRKNKKKMPISNEKLTITKTKQRELIQNKGIKDAEMSSTSIEEKMPVPYEELPSSTKTKKKMYVPNEDTKDSSFVTYQSPMYKASSSEGFQMQSSGSSLENWHPRSQEETNNLGPCTCSTIKRGRNATVYRLLGVTKSRKAHANTKARTMPSRVCTQHNTQHTKIKCKMLPPVRTSISLEERVSSNRSLNPLRQLSRGIISKFKKHKVKCSECMNNQLMNTDVKALENKLDEFIKNACTPHTCNAIKNLESKIEVLEKATYNNNNAVMKDLHEKIEALEKTYYDNEPAIRNLRTNIHNLEKELTQQQNKICFDSTCKVRNKKSLSLAIANGFAAIKSKFTLIKRKSKNCLLQQVPSCSFWRSNHLCEQKATFGCTHANEQIPTYSNVYYAYYVTSLIVPDFHSKIEYKNMGKQKFIENKSVELSNQQNGLRDPIDDINQIGHDNPKMQETRCYTM